MAKLWDRKHNEKILTILTSVPPDQQEGVLRGLINDFEKVCAGDTGLSQMNALAMPMREYRIQPVDPLTFLVSKKYLGLEEELYPKIGEEFQTINSGEYVEVVLTGAIGTAKTTLAIWTTAYQVYLLACLRNPQRTFGIDRSSEILFVFQSLNATLAKQLNYDRFRSLIQTSPFFTDYFPFDTKINTECIFPNRIIVRPISGQVTGAIGQNVFGGMLDEVNFMEVTESSTKAEGGEYDQATTLYDSLSRRRKSRFMKQGKLPGVFCLVSSKRYPGQFTDQKAAEAQREIERTGSTTTYIYDKTTWEVLPESDFSGEWFDIFIGDLSRKPRILEEGDPIDRSKDKDLILAIPVEYRGDFEKDILNALRDIAGVSTLAQHPFIMDNDAIQRGFGNVQSILTRDEVDFDTTKIGVMRPKFMYPKAPRWVHIDLSMTGDATGVASGFVDRFVKVEAGDGTYETLPNIVFDFMLRVIPPKGGEINYQKIRDLLYLLRNLGLNIKWVSCDSFQSTDMMQLLRRKGMSTGMVSIDRDIEPYSFLKTAFYQGRVEAPSHKFVQKEIASLEIDQKKGKVDHPDNGSKDVADAMAGVIFGLTMRREVWAMHHISPVEIPESIQAIAIRKGDKMKKAELPGDE